MSQSIRIEPLASVGRQRRMLASDPSNAARRVVVEMPEATPWSDLSRAALDKFLRDHPAD